MPTQDTKVQNEKFTFGIIDLYDGLGIKNVDVFSLPSLQKVATLKINK